MDVLYILFWIVMILLNLSILVLYLIIRYFLLPSIEFACASLSTQLCIARQVSLLLHKPILVFDRNYVVSTVKFVDKYRVYVDEAGRHAILNSGAQVAFSRFVFCKIAGYYVDVIVEGDAVYVKEPMPVGLDYDAN